MRMTFAIGSLASQDRDFRRMLASRTLTQPIIRNEYNVFSSLLALEMSGGGDEFAVTMTNQTLEIPTFHQAGIEIVDSDGRKLN